jgi:hypothetical protein
VEVNPYLNEQNEDDLLNAGKCSKLVEYLGGGDEGHIEYDIDKQNGQLQHIEHSEEDARVTENVFPFAQCRENA